MNTFLEPDHRHTILIVDDEPQVLEMLKGLMEDDGYEVLTATSGEEALETAGVTELCMVLSDVNMPGMDGYSLCRKLKQDRRNAYLPFVLITVRTSDIDVEEGLEAGAVDYIKKPFDLTELRLRVRTLIRLHETLRQKQALQERLGLIGKVAKDAIVVMDDEGRILYWNRAAEDMFGYTRQEAVFQDLHTLLAPPRFHDAHKAAFQHFRKTGEGAAVGKTMELAAIRKSGEEFPVEVSLSSTWVGGKWHAIGIIRDVTQRKQVEERFRVLFESSRDAMMTLTPDTGRFTSGNPAALEMFGVEDQARFVSLCVSDVSPSVQADGRPSADKAKEMIDTAMREGAHFFPWTHMTVGGVEFPATVLLTRMEVGGQTILQATVRNISKQIRLEAELAHARKLEAVGQLAAGIAHEINTPAQFVGDNIHFLKDAFQDLMALVAQYRRALASPGVVQLHGDVLRELREAEETADLQYLEDHVPRSFDRCIDGLSRISSIVSAMKEFAHPDQRDKNPTDINQALLSTLTITKNEYKYVADLETDLGELPPVMCYGGDLNQVFLNLIVNAAHAIGEVVGDSGAKGLITVRTSCADGIVRIEIQDTGCGIPAGVKNRIFDPFFTTKEVGKGTGQGLAIARSIIVDKHHGTLTCESTEGQGTTFTICLPVDGKPFEAAESAADTG